MIAIDGELRLQWEPLFGDGSHPLQPPTLGAYPCLLLTNYPIRIALVVNMRKPTLAFPLPDAVVSLPRWVACFAFVGFRVDANGSNTTLSDFARTHFSFSRTLDRRRCARLQTRTGLWM